MEYLSMAFGQDFEPMAETFCASYMILEFNAMPMCLQICTVVGLETKMTVQTTPPPHAPHTLNSTL